MPVGSVDNFEIGDQLNLIIEKEDEERRKELEDKKKNRFKKKKKELKLRIVLIMPNGLLSHLETIKIK